MRRTGWMPAGFEPCWAVAIPIRPTNDSSRRAWGRLRPGTISKGRCGWAAHRFSSTWRGLCKPSPRRMCLGSNASHRARRQRRSRQRCCQPTASRTRRFCKAGSTKRRFKHGRICCAARSICRCRRSPNAAKFRHREYRRFSERSRRVILPRNCADCWRGAMSRTDPFFSTGMQQIACRGPP